MVTAAVVLVVADEALVEDDATLAGEDAEVAEPDVVPGSCEPNEQPVRTSNAMRTPTIPNRTQLQADIPLPLPRSRRHWTYRTTPLPTLLTTASRGTVEFHTSPAPKAGQGEMPTP